ncbi:MAG: hypothetical protein GY851_14915 [bacterium]|nr:hypothetical protein [bacterium]
MASLFIGIFLVLAGVVALPRAIAHRRDDIWLLRKIDYYESQLRGIFDRDETETVDLDLLNEGQLKDFLEKNTVESDFLFSFDEGARAKHRESALESVYFAFSAAIVLLSLAGTTFMRRWRVSQDPTLGGRALLWIILFGHFLMPVAVLLAAEAANHGSTPANIAPLLVALVPLEGALVGATAILPRPRRG